MEVSCDIEVGMVEVLTVAVVAAGAIVTGINVTGVAGLVVVFKSVVSKEVKILIRLGVASVSRSFAAVVLV